MILTDNKAGNVGHYLFDLDAAGRGKVVYGFDLVEADRRHAGEARSGSPRLRTMLRQTHSLGGSPVSRLIAIALAALLAVSGNTANLPSKTY